MKKLSRLLVLVSALGFLVACQKTSETANIENTTEVKQNKDYSLSQKEAVKQDTSASDGQGKVANPPLEEAQKGPGLKVIEGRMVKLLEAKENQQAASEDQEPVTQEQDQLLKALQSKKNLMRSDQEQVIILAETSEGIEVEVRSKSPAGDTTSSLGFYRYDYASGDLFELNLETNTYDLV